MKKDKINNKINEMIERMKFCKKEFGSTVFNNQFNYILGYIESLSDWNIINENQYKNYKKILHDAMEV